MNYALTISYRGGGYAGWQRQENARTVQETIEEALVDLLRHSVRIHGAGRTDAGVHARGQVAHLILEHEFPVEALQHGTNQRLPEDIRVMAAHRMPEGFHARKCAASKEYRYRLIRGRVLSPLDAPYAVQAPPGLDVSAMLEATQLLIGRHDWTAFTLAGGGHRQPFRRVLAADWVEQGKAIELHIRGDGFLRGMVRVIAGTLLEVGRGRFSVGEFETLLSGRARTESGPTAPARGLVLQRVHYPATWSLEKAFEPEGGVLD